MPAVEQDIDLVALRQMRSQFFQHLLRQLVLGPEPQALSLGPTPVEPPHRLLPQVQPPGEGIAPLADLHPTGEVHRSLAVGRLAFPAAA